MNKLEPDKSHFKEYKFLYISGILLVLVIGSYFFNFSSEGVGSQGVWGQFGDFIGGVLNPLLSFIVIWILVEDLRLTREDLRLSIQEQMNATETMREQVFLIRPRPQIIVYPLVRRHPGGDFLLLRIFNDGKGQAMNVKIQITKNANKMEEYNVKFLQSGQKLEYFISDANYIMMKQTGLPDGSFLRELIVWVKFDYLNNDFSENHILESGNQFFNFKIDDLLGVSIE